jgi:lysophospholipase L1-like esterase
VVYFAAMRLITSFWKKFIFTGFAVGVLAAAPLMAAIKVACVGDSITAGAGLKNARDEAYPSQLAQKLGAEYEVRNFGVSGRTLLNHGDFPYAREKACQNALDWKADIVIIALGTNDSKPQNIKFAREFVADYKSLIGSFRNANSAVRIYVCLPPPVTPPGAYAINEDVIKRQIIPLAKKVAREENTGLIDFHSELKGKQEYFPDKVHPNAEGAGLMAGIVFDALNGKAATP